MNFGANRVRHKSSCNLPLPRRLWKVLQAQWSAMRAYVRKTPDWGPASILRRCAIVSRLLFLHPAAFFRVVNALSAAKLSSLVRTAPIILLKFSWPVYSNCMSAEGRAIALSHHYGILQRRLSRTLLEKIIAGRATLWEAAAGTSALSISLSVAQATYGEGEMNLHFQVDSSDVYVLSFVIVPARLLGLEADSAIYVTRLQGTKGHADSIRLATKGVGDVSPALTLMAAAEGVALALGVEHILGISAKEQICSAADPPTGDFISAYDEFWRSIEGRKLTAGSFYFPVPLPEKALALIKQNHRPRVKARRAFRRAVSDRVRAQIVRIGYDA